MSIQQLLTKAVRQLTRRGVVSAELDAELLLAEAVRRPREYVLAHPECQLTANQAKKFSGYLKRRLAYEPVAYILGRKEFFGLELKVDKRVLIPRPETETVCEFALDFARQNKIKKFIDVGTGSGAIALALKSAAPQAEVLATDDSAPALALARQNARRLKLPVEFLNSDLLQRVSDQRLAGAVIVANLPYLDRATIRKYPAALKKQLAYEPAAALYAGQHGAALYAELFKQLAERSARPRAVFCEIGPCHFQEYYRAARRYFSAKQIGVKNDLAGKKRCLIIEF